MQNKAGHAQADGGGSAAAPAAGHPFADAVLGAKPRGPEGPLQWLKAQLRWLAIKAVGAVLGAPLGLRLLFDLITR